MLCSQVRPRMTHTLTRKGMTKSEARSTLELLCYLRVVVILALYLFIATAFALRYSASGRDRTVVGGTSVGPQEERPEEKAPSDEEAGGTSTEGGGGGI
ncbi:hypothetical protein Taro_055497 [Colocasia esculenta]|uniref:Uncharacterized protein n=1 Tax=Colocasia esculenta TaxID=4460 RepID=A0A843XUE1_COLES|nr:hypothetical protein [Colocasia esculenta]